VGLTFSEPKRDLWNALK